MHDLTFIDSTAVNRQQQEQNATQSRAVTTMTRRVVDVDGVIWEICKTIFMALWGGRRRATTTTTTLLCSWCFKSVVHQPVIGELFIPIMIYSSCQSLFASQCNWLCISTVHHSHFERTSFCQSVVRLTIQCIDLRGTWISPCWVRCVTRVIYCVKFSCSQETAIHFNDIDVPTHGPALIEPSKSAASLSSIIIGMGCWWGKWLFTS